MATFFETPERETFEGFEPSEIEGYDPLAVDEPDMEVTHFFWKEPGFDQMYAQAKDWLEMPGGMLKRYGIMPVNIGQQAVTANNNPNRTLFLARFELPNWGAAFQHPEAILQSAQQQGTVAGWIDFLTGLPFACIELMAMVGEMSSIPDLQAGMVEEVASTGQVSPRFPKTLFGGYESNKIVTNLIYLSSGVSQWMPPDLQGPPKVQGLHWWCRVCLMGILGGTPQKFPYPSEFMALAVRLFPDRYWGTQESNPFMISGNFIDFVYLTSGFVTAVSTPTAEFPYPQYTIQWRKNPNDPNNSGIYTVLPTDFSEYKGPQGDATVGDRVVILKDVTATKTSELWSDPDMNTLGGGEAPSSGNPVPNCSVVPLYFYGINPDQPIS